MFKINSKFKIILPIALFIFLLTAFVYIVAVKSINAEVLSRIVTGNQLTEIKNPQEGFTLASDPTFKISSPNKSPTSVAAYVMSKNNQSTYTADVKQDNNGGLEVSVPKEQLIPGDYTLTVESKESIFYTRTLTQDFTWGVIAINFNKSVYVTGDKIKISLGVVDDKGHTLCDAKLKLQIRNPKSETKILSTDEGTINKSENCKGDSFTLEPDYSAGFKAADIGKYQVTVTAQTKNGLRIAQDYFEVKDNVDFDVERTQFPSRIYPPEPYPVILTIKANKDFSGEIVETVPENFEINDSDSNKNLKFKIENSFEGRKKLVWNMDLKAGNEYKLSYIITFPDKSPEFYLLGPLRLADARSGQALFEEQRLWQIAADTVISGTHKAEIHTSADATFYDTGSWTPTANRLAIASVANSLAATPTTPTLTGNGLTWSQVVTYLNDTSGTQHRQTVFVALTGGSPSTGAVRADYGGVTQLSQNIVVDEFDGADISGTALQAIVQSVTGTVNGSGTSETITLAALSDSNNASYGIIFHQANEATVEGNGYTLLHSGSHSGPSVGIGTEYLVPGSTTVDGSWATSIQKGGIALEIKASAAGQAPGVYSGNWRWYTDATPDGSMTALEAENTRPTLTGAQMHNSIVRLRAQIVDTTGSPSSGGVQLQYSEDGTNWRNIASNSLVAGEEGVWLRWANGAATASATVGSQLLTSTNASGLYHEAQNVSESVSANNIREIDAAIKVHYPPPDTNIRIRIVYNGSPLSLLDGATEIQVRASSISARENTIDKMSSASDGTRALELRFSPWNRMFYDGSHWWLFTVHPNDETNIAYYYWDGVGNWSAKSTVAMTGGMAGAVHAPAFKVINGTPVVFIVQRTSSTTRRWIRGTITGTTITWGTEGSQAIASDRYVHADIDDGNYWWMGGIRDGVGVWAARATNADLGSGGWIAGFNTEKTASDASATSGSIFRIVGLSASKALAIWRSGNALKWSIVTESGGFGTVNTLASSASAEDWGVVRSRGYVYVVHTEGTADGSPRRLSIFNEATETFSAGPNPGEPGVPDDSGSFDGLPLAANGDDIYFFGTYKGTEGGQDRYLGYRKYTGPGTTGSWGTRTTLPVWESSNSTGNLDYLGVTPYAALNKIIAYTLSGDDDLLHSGFAIDYHVVDIPAPSIKMNGLKLDGLKVD